ncbi:MAG: DNA topoisomerase IB [Actinomycetota bacterium]|nr:DNA topoisomerase IB [Actinomycetota bacterium]
MPRLRRADCSAPGYTRRGCGRGFAYHDERGQRLTDQEILDRIAALVIPPAWKDVWICPWANGHLQAVGTDAAGRRQYLYHPAWRERRDREKFDHMLEFARCLPGLRAACASTLAAGDGLDRERVLACAVRLLDLGFFRIGTEGYADQNQSFGLATIRKDHVRLLDGHALEFDYVAKSGQRRLQTVVDPAVFDVVAALKRRRGSGDELLAYRNAKRWHDVRSEEINAYIKELTGDEFTAKDFRTWNATVLAAVALAVSTAARSATARKRAVARAMQEVASYLGNTPAVCRSSYVDPRVVDRYQAGTTISAALEGLAEEGGAGLSFQGAVEEAVLDLLTNGAHPVSRAA